MNGITVLAKHVYLASLNYGYFSCEHIGTAPRVCCLFFSCQICVKQTTVYVQPLLNSWEDEWNENVKRTLKSAIQLKWVGAVVKLELPSKSPLDFIKTRNEGGFCVFCFVLNCGHNPNWFSSFGERAKQIQGPGIKDSIAGCRILLYFQLCHCWKVG